MKKKLSVALVLVAAAHLSLAPAAFAQEEFRSDLAPLNGSGATGTADLMLEGETLTANLTGQGLVPLQPHAQHIHGLGDAQAECPTLANDRDGDGLINTIEGQPAYGPILNSLTTSGDTSPGSSLAVDRFPVADESGTTTYERTFELSPDVAARLGEHALVQHGVDLNGNGVYDGPASVLDPAVPMEATLPANCGLIVPVGG